MSSRSFILPAGWVLLTCVVAAAEDAPETPDALSLQLDFADAAQRDALHEQPVDGARYPHAAEPGPDGVPGVLLSNNRGDDAAQLWLRDRTFDLRRQAVTMSVDVKAETSMAPGNGGGTTRVFLGLAERDDVDLGKGEGKLGVRIFKSGKPKIPDRPFALQLVNGVATRNLGEQFALESGKWYRMSIRLALKDGGEAIAFDASLHELDANAQPTGLSRAVDSQTQVLDAYRLNAMCVGLLSQHNQGGAAAIDNIAVSAEALPNSIAVDEPLTDVAFLPPPLPDDLIAPGTTLFGACGHFMHTDAFYRKGEFGAYWRLEYTLPFLVNARLGWIREPLYQPWFDDPDNRNAIENRQTVERYLNLYQRHGVRVMLVAMAVNDHDAKHAALRDGYFTWLGELAARYPCVRVIEMHNEPNLKFFWPGTVEDYVRVYRHGAELIRAKRPDVEIAVGSMSSLWWEPGVDWFRKLAELGGLEFADAVSVHPYHKKAPPEQDPHYTGAARDSGDHLQQAAAAFGDLVSSLSPPGKRLKLYFTELGYSSGDEGIAALSDEMLQADYLSRSMLLYLDLNFRGLPLEGVFWYDLKNDGPSRHGESNFGLIAHDTSRLKPAYDVYRQIAQSFDEPAAWSAIDLPVTSSNLPNAVKTLTWRRSDGSIVVPFWRMEQRQAKDADFPTQLTIVLPDGFTASRVMLHRLDEAAPRVIGHVAAAGSLHVPVLISRRAAWLVLHPQEASP